MATELAISALPVPPTASAEAEVVIAFPNAANPT
jgi:hypothetical protein